jgi:hypothetical protein
VFFRSSRKNVRRARSMSAVPTGFRTNCWFRQPHATTPRNKDRFLGTPVKRGANSHCAYGAGEGLLPAWSAPALAPLRGTTINPPALPEDSYSHGHGTRCSGIIVRAGPRVQGSCCGPHTGWLDCVLRPWPHTGPYRRWPEGIPRLQTRRQDRIQWRQCCKPW